MTASTELRKKLQVKASARLWLINVPRELAETPTAGAEVDDIWSGARFRETARVKAKEA
jgi:hypothetical protein